MLSRVSPLGFGGCGSLDTAWSLVNLKSSPEVVDKDMDPRGEDTDWGS